MSAPRPLGRRRLIGGALAGIGLGLLPRRAAAAAPFEAVPKHLQVYRTPPAAWTRMVEFSRRLGIGSIAIAIRAEDRARFIADNAFGIEAFAPLRESGLDVRCMVGDPAWVLERPDTLPLDLIETLHLHERVFRFKGLVLDPDPQALAEWKSARRPDLVRGTLSLLATVRAACTVRQLSLSAALAPWYAGTPDPDRRGESFLDSALRRADEAMLMTYRDDPDQALAMAGGALDALARHDVPYWFGVAARPVPARAAADQRPTLAHFAHGVAALHAKLGEQDRRRQVAGIAIHQFATLRQLVQAA